MTPQTRFYIASTGKMLVAAAVLAFAEDGTLALDEPVWPHIQNISGIDALKDSRRVTLRQLLVHTSGLNDYLDDAFFDASELQPSKRWSAAEAISFAYDGDVTHAPGRGFSYSNSNYVLLGHVLAQVAGSLENALSQKVFSKADMSETTVGMPTDNHSLAHGYMEDSVVSAQAWASILGDGQVISTVGNLEKFAFALFRDGKILGADVLLEMTQGSNANEGYGLGMGIDGDQWGEWFGHAGSYDDFEADFRYYPDDKTVFVFVTNGNVPNEDSILDAASDGYFGG
jgi:D-alanyl-D-alanine carboxypeptidase